MDRRQKRTREAIIDAFISLLSEKRFARITVQEIIDRADVGRSTFYAHFQSRDDLLRELCENLFTHVFSDSLDTESTHDFSMKTGNPDAIITHILYHLLDDDKKIIRIIASDSDELFLRCFREYLDEFLARRLLAGVPLEDIDIPYDFLVNHISSSFIGLVHWWIKGKLKESPEELSRYFRAMIDLSHPEGMA